MSQRLGSLRQRCRTVSEHNEKCSSFYLFSFSYVLSFCFINQAASFDSLVASIISCLSVGYEKLR